MRFSYLRSYLLGIGIIACGLDGFSQSLQVFPKSGSPVYPLGKLTESKDGNFYGVTFDGGSAKKGSIFRVTKDGRVTEIASFLGGMTGEYPCGSLTLADDGNFYGTARGGGQDSIGTVFKVTPTGTLTTVASFTSKTGGRPLGNLTLGKDGSLYGTTNDPGSVFKLENGMIRVLSLNWKEGLSGKLLRPFGDLVPDGQDAFVGTSQHGGQVNNHSMGMLFRITTSGDASRLASVPFSLPGDSGISGVGQTLVYAARQNVVRTDDGSIYGVTRDGGQHGDGMLFKLERSGALKVIVSFSRSNQNFQYPLGGLVLGPTKEVVIFGTLLANDNWVKQTVLPCGDRAGDRRLGWIRHKGIAVPVEAAVLRISGDGTIQPAAVLRGGLSERVVFGSDGYLYGMTSGALFKLTVSALKTPTGN